MIKGAQRAQGKGGGGKSGFQVTVMTEWDQISKAKKLLRASSKPQKIPGPRLSPQKIPRQISEP